MTKMKKQYTRISRKQKLLLLELESWGEVQGRAHLPPISHVTRWTLPSICTTASCLCLLSSASISLFFKLGKNGTHGVFLLLLPFVSIDFGFSVTNDCFNLHIFWYFTSFFPPVSWIIYNSQSCVYVIFKSWLG